VVPNAGAGTSPTFSYLVSDQNGATDLTQVWMEISTTLSSAANSCFVLYDVTPNTLYLLNDAATAWLGPVTPGAAGSLQGSQCVLNAASSSVSLSGNNVTVNISVTFKKPAFSGPKNLYAYANNATFDTGWQLTGSWTVQ
jgi:hypothetical protein